ncbi:MAG TPA: DUF1684 domain-containing protein [Thermoanaerobaculia bacterium]|nr:DUF1684 domain-containing protein [Thermoanaerobaculia bacterium]
MKRLLILLMLSAAFLSCHRASSSPPPEFTQWREKRLANLTKEDGWLTLVGLDWLKEGPNEISIPSKPPAVIHATLVSGKVTLEPSPSLMIDGKPLAGPTVLRNDADPQGPTIVQLGTIRFYAIKRNDRYGFRVRDLASDARTKFAGLDYFPYDPNYRLEAKWVPYDPPHAIPITNVLGMTSSETAPGRLVFTIDGKEYSVEPILEQGESDLFIIFRDQTAGKETYGAARYLYASPPGPDGKVVVDFNKAYNPPCAFTPFATCPLPPAQNKLPIRIEAGEKKYAGGHA